ncbi:MAG TPA: hypothetical protein VNS59_01890 [Lysobacter sp.]|nr:hypothetical protein [Lysobacter sp.]
MQIKRTHCLLGLALVATAAMAANPAFLRKIGYAPEQLSAIRIDVPKPGA